MREKKLRKIIREELTRTIQVERGGRPGEDTPMEGKSFEKVEVNVLDWFCSYLPYIEQALRTMEKTVKENNNKIFKELAPGLEALTEIFIANEKNIMEIAKLAKKFEKVVEITHNESNTQKRLNNKIVD